MKEGTLKVQLQNLVEVTHEVDALPLRHGQVTIAVPPLVVSSEAKPKGQVETLSHTMLQNHGGS